MLKMCFFLSAETLNMLSHAGSNIRKVCLAEMLNMLTSLGQWEAKRDQIETTLFDIFNIFIRNKHIFRKLHSTSFNISAEKNHILSKNDFFLLKCSICKNFCKGRDRGKLIQHIQHLSRKKQTFQKYHSTDDSTYSTFQ